MNILQEVSRLIDSFYGGHEGVSFILRNSFESYEAMVNAFKQGSNYTDVWFEEYCIIDTVNKNDPDNGKIYKRGLDYQSTSGGAIYLGQIVGPSSGTPWFQMTTIPKVVEKTKEALESNSYRRYPTGVDGSGNIITNWTYDSTTNHWSDSGGDIKQDFSFSTKNDTSLVPGKKDDGTFNDEIKWTWCNIRKDDADKDSYYYVGFQIPYMVTDYAIHQTSPYDAAGNILTDATDIRRVDDKTHPFYEKWDLGLPKGIKGDTLRNLRVITPTTTNKSNIYRSSAITVNDTTGETSIGAAGYDGIDDDIAHGRQIVVFDFYAFDKRRNPSPIMIYLGDFNIIKNITIADDGTLTVSYTHNDNSVFTKRIKWVTGVNLTTGNGSAGGHFSMTFNNGDPAYQTDLTWVKGIEIADNGDVTYTYAGTDSGKIANNGLKVVSHLVKWVKNVTLDTSNGQFILTLNDGTVACSKTLDWVKDLQINEENGEIKAIHTANPQSRTLDAKLRLITSATVDSTGVTTFFFNTSTNGVRDSFVLKNADGSTDYHIKAINSVTLNSGITSDKHITVRYNTGEVAQLGDPINDIAGITVRPSDWHLFILFSDPTHRVTAANLKSDGTDNSGFSWISNDVVKGFDSSVPSYGSDVYWKDLGAIKDQSGILVGFNVTKEEVTKAGFQEPIDYFNAKFPNGLTGDQNEYGGMAVKEKIITYAPKDISSDGKDDKEFYAFDYNKNTWYYLGKIADTGVRDVVLVNQGDAATAYANLSTEGLAFTKVPTTVSDNAIPQFWKSTYEQ